MCVSRVCFNITTKTHKFSTSVFGNGINDSFFSQIVFEDATSIEILTAFIAATELTDHGALAVDQHMPAGVPLHRIDFVVLALVFDNLLGRLAVVHTPETTVHITT